MLGSVFEETLHNTPDSIAEYLVFILAYLLSGWTVLTTAGRNILRGQVFDENFLMTIVTLGAIAIHKREHPTFYLLQGDKPYVLG